MEQSAQNEFNRASELTKLFGGTKINCEEKKKKVKKMSAMLVLKNACLKKPYKSFKDLAPGEYIIKQFSVVTSKYEGKRIVRIDMEESYMYLPERFATSMTDAIIAELNASPKIMVFTGKDMNDRERLILDFHDVSYFAQGLV